MSQVEDIVRRYYAASNARQYDLYDQLFAMDCTIETPGQLAHGIDAVKEFDKAWAVAFPDNRAESLKMMNAGTLVATANWFHAGEHKGVLKFGNISLPPTHKVLGAPYTSAFRVLNGRIALQRIMFDPTSIPELLGLTGSSATAV